MERKSDRQTKKKNEGDQKIARETTGDFCSA